MRRMATMRPRLTTTRLDMEGWTLIRKVSQPFQADLLKATLEGQGIPALILNKRDSSYGMFGEVEVHVGQSDAERAAEVLAALDGPSEGA